MSSGPGAHVLICSCAHMQRHSPTTGLRDDAVHDDRRSRSTRQEPIAFSSFVGVDRRDGAALHAFRPGTEVSCAIFLPGVSHKFAPVYWRHDSPRITAHENRVADALVRWSHRP